MLELRVCNSWITNQILDIKNQKFELFFPKYDNFKRNQHTRCLSVYLPMKDEMMKEQNSNKLYIKIKNLLIFVFTKQYFSLNSNLGLSNFMQKRKNWWASSETCTGHKWMDGQERENRQTAKSLDNTSFYDGSINR